MASPNGNDNRVDWAETFDLIASEYGYTWKQFIRLTYKQLYHCLKAIKRRIHNKTAVLAAMHGIKMEFYKEIKSPSKEILQKAQVEIDKILKEKQAIHGKR